MFQTLLTSLFVLFFGREDHSTLGSLLVVDKAGNAVSIVDLDAGKEIAKIPTGNYPHEVAVSPNGQSAVVSNYGAQEPGNSLSVIDVTRKTSTKTIDLRDYKRPHGLEFISDTEVLVTSEATQTLIKVNIQSGKVAEVAKTGQAVSHMIAYSKRDHKAYVANVKDGTVSVIDVTGNKLINQITLKPGIEGLDISPDGKELWVANRNDSTVAVVNTSTLEQEAILPAHQIAFRVKFIPDGLHVVVSNGMTGNLSVYDVRKRELIKDVDFYNLNNGVENIGKIRDKENPPVPVGIAVHGEGKFVYIANAHYGLVAVVDTNTWNVVAKIETGGSPDGIYWGKAKVN
jgi:YVTN family beta-propeller protein